MSTYEKKDPNGLVTTARVEHGPGHSRLTVWVHGKNVGTLTLDAEHAEMLAALLVPLTETSESEYTGGTDDEG